jgi:hypothetical protein
MAEIMTFLMDQNAEIEPKLFNALRRLMDRALYEG